MRGFSFIHTADLHLDSPFSGVRRVEGEMAELFGDATFRAFDNLVDLAIGRGVDFLVVAGDVYDAAERSLRAQLKFASGLEKLADAGIRSFVCHGNHDPLDGWSATLHWPDEVHIFGPELESVVLRIAGENLVRVHGISYPHRNIDTSFGTGFKRLGPEPFQIGLLHCSVGSHPDHETCAPRRLEDLAAAGLDYWALGHVHTRRVLMDGCPYVAYPGNIQGRHIREPGPRGCLLVKVGPRGELEAGFEPVDAVRWFCPELQISDLETEGDLVQALERLCEQMSSEAGARPAVARITLCGRGPLHQVLHRNRVVEDLTERLRETGFEASPPLYIEKLRVQTNPEIEIDSRRKSADFVGETLRLIQRYREEPESLYQVIGALYEDRRGSRYLQRPGREELLELIREAELLCLDRIVDEEAE